MTLAPKGSRNHPALHRQMGAISQRKKQRLGKMHRSVAWTVSQSYLPGKESSFKEGCRESGEHTLWHQCWDLGAVASVLGPGARPEVLRSPTGKSIWIPFFSQKKKKRSASHSCINIAVNTWQFILHPDCKRQGTCFIARFHPHVSTLISSFLPLPALKGSPVKMVSWIII